MQSIGFLDNGNNKIGAFEMKRTIDKTADRKVLVGPRCQTDRIWWDLDP